MQTAEVARTLNGSAAEVAANAVHFDPLRSLRVRADAHHRRPALRGSRIAEAAELPARRTTRTACLVVLLVRRTDRAGWRIDDRRRSSCADRGIHLQRRDGRRVLYGPRAEGLLAADQ